MYYVYILGLSDGAEYIGFTRDIRRRFQEHNLGIVASTRKFRPVQLLWFCVFRDKQKALAFERYLKSGSGTAFRRKRLF